MNRWDTINGLVGSTFRAISQRARHIELCFDMLCNESNQKSTMYHEWNCLQDI